MLDFSLCKRIHRYKFEVAEYFFIYFITQGPIRSFLASKRALIFGPTKITVCTRFDDKLQISATGPHHSWKEGSKACSGVE